MTRILIADDNRDLRRLWAEALAAPHRTILQASNGREAVALAQTSAPDIAIVDLIMPSLDGVETISQLRLAAPECLFIAVSGGGATHTTVFLQAAKKFGAAHALQKPVDVRKLKALVDAADCGAAAVG